MGEFETANLRDKVSLLTTAVVDLRLCITELRSKDEHLQEQISGMSDDLEEVEGQLKLATAMPYKVTLP